MRMEGLYLAAGITRQSFHNWLARGRSERERTAPAAVLEMAREVRAKFLPGSCARELYLYIRKRHEGYNSALLGWGKHRFEAFCLKNGFRVEYRRFVPKTTVRGDYVFPNRIEGLELSGTDQVWASDICYIFGEEGQLLGYATSLIDLYSRRLLGLSFSRSMRAEETAHRVLRQALDTRGRTSFDGAIFHSDGGKQYIESTFVQLLRKHGIQSSMAENCYENAFAESFNDTLKNHMLHDTKLNSFDQLKKLEPFVKHCYNDNKPHNNLNRMTPNEFEQHIMSTQNCQKTLLKIKIIEQSKTSAKHLVSLNQS